jgi:hypothetical protein
MLIDGSLQFAATTPVANGAGTTLIGNQIDCGIQGALDNGGEDLYLVITVAQAIVAAGAGTLKFQLASDTTAAISTSGSAIPVIVTEAFATSTTPIPAGTVLYAGPLPKDVGTYSPSKRFLGLLEIVGTASITSGAVTSFITFDPPSFGAVTAKVAD